MKYWIAAWGIFAAFVIGSMLLLQVVLQIPIEEPVEGLVKQAGPAGMVGVVLLLGIDLVLPIPSSLVMILSGALFGGLPGGFLSLLGSLIGNLLGFELARRYGRRFTERHLGEQDFDHSRRLLQKYGPLAIILSRPIPVLMETFSLVAGLTSMSRHVFLTASIMGTLPVSFIYSFAGSLSWDRASIVPALLAGILFPALAWLIVRRSVSRLSSEFDV